ncbi:hypothetical protein GCM10009551_050330 [Nocardiopsis tropica]
MPTAPALPADRAHGGVVLPGRAGPGHPGPRVPARLCAVAGRFAAGARAESTAADRALPPRGGRGCPTGYGTGRIVLDLRVHRTLEGTNETMNPITARGLTGAA